MSAPRPAMHPLALHPASPPGALRAVYAAAARVAGGGVTLRFVLVGDLSRIAVPASRKPRRADGLWRHTCCEWFVRADGDGYLEFNFSPSGEWAAYAFRGYRDAAPLPAAFEPFIAVTRTGDALQLEATLRPAAVPAAARARWRIGLSAVIEDQSGGLSYWALRHAPGKPDFHHADAFALDL